MKKDIAIIPIIILPYTLLFFMYCVKTGFLIDTYFDHLVFVPILIVMMVYLITSIYSIVLSIRYIQSNVHYLEIMELNLIVKLAHIPAFIAMFVLGAGFMLTIMFIVTFAIVLLNCVTIGNSGVIGASGLYKAYKAKAITQNQVVLYVISQFVFVVDVVGAYLLYQKLEIDLQNANPITARDRLL